MLLPLLAGATCAATILGIPGRASPADTLLYRSEDVRYPSGSVQLAAELMLPRGTRTPVPGAVVLQGSGASDRSNQWARAIAEELVGKGIVVLLTDKRGSGASGGDWRTVGFDTLAGDALAGVRYLQGRPEVRAGEVGLVGLSQGGWVAPLAAARAPQAVRFVVDISGAAVSFAEQTYHEMANTARQAGLGEVEVRQVLEMNRAVGEYLATGDWNAYERARQRALGSSWRPIAEGFPDSPDLPVWGFLREVADFSPLPYWIQLRQPVLVLYGEADERDNVPVQESVRRLEHAFGSAGKQNHRIVVIPGAGHAFIDPGTRELMPEFVSALGGWIRDNVVSGGPREVAGAGSRERIRDACAHVPGARAGQLLAPAPHLRPRRARPLPAAPLSPEVPHAAAGDPQIQRF